MDYNQNYNVEFLPNQNTNFQQTSTTNRVGGPLVHNSFQNQFGFNSLQNDMSNFRQSSELNPTAIFVPQMDNNINNNNLNNNNINNNNLNNNNNNYFISPSPPSSKAKIFDDLANQSPNTFSNRNIPSPSNPTDQMQFFQNENWQNQIANIGLQYVQSNVNNVAQEYIISSNSWAQSLKYYFSVNNNYVKGKLQLLSFPFRHKNWERIITGSEAFELPKNDLNAPDLYIPTMAYVTYILVAGLVLGQQLKFNPEVLGKLASSGFAMWLFQVFLLKVSLFLISSDSCSWLDLFAFCGYSFVCIVFNLIAKLLLGFTLSTIVTFYTSLCMAWFMRRTLQKAIVRKGPNNIGRQYVIAVAFLAQFFFIPIMGYFSS
eukprot:TRINITY_DN1293_c0_g5_i1.p1 TRINITY_DN1293_c0_g5~~TRINITY_DN1293_c0_g5_i1.p1  ORF type:complete len:373 (+),score=145.20 TRINITY_DN1293_c0_g5_i1:37-1155(+)